MAQGVYQISVAIFLIIVQLQIVGKETAIFQQGLIAQLALKWQIVSNVVQLRVKLAVAVLLDFMLMISINVAVVQLVALLASARQPVLLAKQATPLPKNFLKDNVFSVLLHARPAVDLQITVLLA